MISDFINTLQTQANNLVGVPDAQFVAYQLDGQIAILEELEQELKFLTKIRDPIPYTREDHQV